MRGERFPRLGGSNDIKIRNDMKPNEPQKLCPNCDGRIAKDISKCPYCFTVQQSASKNISALYTPSSYSEKPIDSAKKISSIEEHTSTEQGACFWPVFFLTLASHLFTLGVLQFLFSTHGMIYLEINGKFWFLMVLISLPLFYTSLKKLSLKKQDSEL